MIAMLVSTGERVQRFFGLLNETSKKDEKKKKQTQSQMNQKAFTNKTIIELLQTRIVLKKAAQRDSAC